MLNAAAGNNAPMNIAAFNIAALDIDRTKFAVLLAVTLALSMGAAHAVAHETAMAPCEKPVRPANDQDDTLWQRFLEEIDTYRACVNARMDWHQEASRDHQEQARLAVEAWNSFVRTSLNAPEDFPWPPEEK